MAEEQGKAREMGEGDLAGIKVYIDVSGDVHGTINGVYIEHYHAGEPVKKWVPLDSLDRADHFQGREEEIAQLKEALLPGEMATIVAAGGMGKSALAAQVAWELTKELREPPEDFPDGVVAYTFYGGGSTSGAFIHIARAFGIEVGETDDSPAEAAQRALSRKSALLVLDGAEALREGDGGLGRLDQVLAMRGRCGVLITTRDRRDGKGTTLELEPLDEDTAAAVVMAHGGEFAKEWEAVLEICELVGRLPLGLRLAGSYLSANQTYAREYVKKLPDRLWEDLSTEERQHESITVLMEESLRQVSLEARDVLGAASTLALAPFPSEAILMGTIENWEEEEEARDKQWEQELEEVADALSELGRYGLVRRVGEEWQISHSLIRLYTNEVGLVPEGTLGRLVKSYLALAYSANELKNPVVFEGLRGHVRALAEQAEVAELEEAGGLWVNLGYFMDMIGDYANAKEIYERALKLNISKYGREHPSVATNVNNLGNVLLVQGDLAGAREMFERARSINEAEFGPLHQSVATNVNNLGRVLYAEGDVLGALEMFNTALKIGEATYGEEHPDIATWMNNIGLVLKDLGGTEAALDMYKQALAIDVKAFGSAHQAVARDVNNLGMVYKELGDLVRAREMYERALRIWENKYGENHPDLASTLNNLASVKYKQGDLAGALEIFERALKILELIYGAEHPLVATTMHNIGMVLEKQGELRKAKEMYERSLVIREKMLPEGHPSTEASKRWLDAVNREIEERDKGKED